MEWLLATHENGQGPVDWSDEQQRDRKGLDLRGANLFRINLSNLPLLVCKEDSVLLTFSYKKISHLTTPTNEQFDEAIVHLELSRLDWCTFRRCYSSWSPIEWRIP